MMRVLTTRQAEEWNAVLQRVARHDFYSLPGYHALAERQGEGRALLFVFERGEYLVALPLLLRAIDDADGWFDATSVYGYAGPVCSHGELPEAVERDFQTALHDALAAQRIVAVFSRLHPLLPQGVLLAGLGECRPGGQTISIDLTLPPDSQRAQYRDTFRQRLGKLSQAGIEGVVDADLRHLAEFTSIYHENMRRVNAHGSYFFDLEYFTQLAAALGPRLQLVLVKSGDEILAAALFTLCGGIVQYHLGGTRDAALPLSPTPLVIDTARLWAIEQGAHTLHLGGGVGAKEDSLFLFKTGFSKSRHEFATWRWVVTPEIYAQLCKRRGPSSSDFFPAYRSPADADEPALIK